MKEIRAKGTGQTRWRVEDESGLLRCVAKTDSTRECEDALSIIKYGASDIDSGDYQRTKRRMAGPAVPDARRQTRCT